MEFPTAPPPTNQSYWVVESELAAGAYPGSLDPTDDMTVRRLLEAGVSAFVNLTEDLDPSSTDATLNRYDGMVGESALIMRHPITCLLYTSPSPRDGLLS